MALSVFPVAVASSGGSSNVAKTILYYFHERGWNHIQWGRK